MRAVRAKAHKIVGSILKPTTPPTFLAHTAITGHPIQHKSPPQQLPILPRLLTTIHLHQHMKRSSPTWQKGVIRSKLQEQGQVRNSETRYAGVIDCVKKVFRKEGLPGFYRGCATNLLRMTTSAIITFTSYYEMIHRFCHRALHAHDEANGLVNSKGTEGGAKEKYSSSQSKTPTYK